jgi:hypothetical protein
METMAKLNVKAFTLACGATWGIFMVVIGWGGIIGWGTSIVDLLSSLYIGLAPTFLGGIIGGLWGFLDGAIGGLVFTLLYNAMAKK